MKFKSNARARLLMGMTVAVNWAMRTCAMRPRPRPWPCPPIASGILLHQDMKDILCKGVVASNLYIRWEIVRLLKGWAQKCIRGSRAISKRNGYKLSTWSHPRGPILKDCYDVAIIVKFYCDCDVAKSLRMGPKAPPNFFSALYCVFRDLIHSAQCQEQ